ncbi:hypothetical protein GOP47_0007649 [Adiantum capillus-veneris]|uniref:Pentatricopeptide repeat-containing protein n=1 Tax=Adiantum capillus-veneris TaxID=13818 RepID=A0A9D4V1P4_ADICA|nr:hypothetical protein GOP47_0007649 [Adiantum capillus-veneris]
MRTDPSTAAAEVMTLFQQGNTEQALQLLHAMRSQGLHSACDDTYCHLLSRKVPVPIMSLIYVFSGHVPVMVCCAKDRTVVSWNSLIAGYVKHSDYETAFFLFMEMELQD